MSKSYLLLLLLSIVLALLLFAFLKPIRAAQLVGGPCSYAEVPGTARILEAAPVPAGKERGQRTAQAFRVLFAFEPGAPVKSPLYRPGASHELTLAGGDRPTMAFLKKYRIRPGATFSARMGLIEKGTCTPVVFSLEGVDLTDHAAQGAN